MSGKVIKEGYMVKSPPLEKNFAQWKKRYFRLFESGRLDYYLNRHDNSRTSKGIINLLDCDCIEPIGHYPGHSNCIRVVSPNRIFILECSSQNDVRQWCEKLLSTRDNALGRTPIAAVDPLTPENGPELQTDAGVRPPVSSQAHPSSDAGSPFVSPLQHESSTLSPPPRPTKSSYSPQPARTPGYVPGQAPLENGGRKVMSQSTCTARSPWEAHTQPQGDVSNLDAFPDKPSRATLSFDDFTIGVRSPQERPVTSSSYQQSSQRSAMGDPDSDKYGYIPMQRQAPGGSTVADDEYERMAEQEIRPPSQLAMPPKSSPRPGRQSIATTPEFQPSPRLCRQSVATPPDFETPDGYETWSSQAPNTSATLPHPASYAGHAAGPPQLPQRAQQKPPWPQKQTNRRAPPRSTRNSATSTAPLPPQKPRGISMRQF